MQPEPFLRRHFLVSKKNKVKLKLIFYSWRLLTPKKANKINGSFLKICEDVVPRDWVNKLVIH